MNIGIFDNTNYNYILKFVRKNYNINLINDFKIYNAFSIKNIGRHYDVLIILSDVTEANREKIEHVISKSKILIINGDDLELYNILEKANINNSYILSYGFNTKSTITVSSIDKFEKKAICILQRSILDINNKLIEQREMCINKGESNFSDYKLLGIVSLLLILGYSDIIFK